MKPNILATFGLLLSLSSALAAADDIPPYPMVTDENGQRRYLFNIELEDDEKGSVQNAAARLKPFVQQCGEIGLDSATDDYWIRCVPRKDVDLKSLGTFLRNIDEAESDGPVDVNLMLVEPAAINSSTETRRAATLFANPRQVVELRDRVSYEQGLANEEINRAAEAFNNGGVTLTKLDTAQAALTAKSQWNNTDRGTAMAISAAWVQLWSRCLEKQRSVDAEPGRAPDAVVDLMFHDCSNFETKAREVRTLMLSDSMARPQALAETDKQFADYRKNMRANTVARLKQQN